MHGEVVIDTILTQSRDLVIFMPGNWREFRLCPVSLEEEEKTAILYDYYSSFDHKKEKAFPGYHKVELDRYGITAELTSTRRVGFHRYAYSPEKENSIIFNLGGLLGPSEISGGVLTKVDEFTLQGSLINEPTRRRPKPTSVFFYVKLDQKVKNVFPGENGRFQVNFANSRVSEVMMKVAISYTSVENAKLNLETELLDWDFEKVVSDSRKEWNEMLGRIEIEGGSEQDQRRF